VERSRIRSGCGDRHPLFSPLSFPPCRTGGKYKDQRQSGPSVQIIRFTCDEEGSCQKKKGVP